MKSAWPRQLQDTNQNEYNLLVNRHLINYAHMKQANEPEESALTDKMDIGTKGFDDFQAIILNRSRQRSENQKRKIDLLTFKYSDYSLNDLIVYIKTRCNSKD